jgi:cell division protein DivIC
MKLPKISQIPVLKSLPSWLFNKYLIVLLVYGTYMILFDSNHFRSQFRQAGVLRNLEKQRDYYARQLDEVKKERAQLFSDPESVEQFARENYFMKKDDETVYVFVEE